MRPTSLITFIAFCSAFLATPAYGLGASNCPDDPFLDPKNDVCNPLRYIPSNVLTAIALVLILQVAISQVFCIRKWGAKWMLAMTVGAFTFAMGIAVRFALHSKPDTIGIYVFENFFVVLSPCAFIAADYVLLGRLARHIRCEEYLMVNPRHITKFFIISDVLTFLIQGSGGGLAASQGMAEIGSHIFLVGLILQLVSFVFFSCIYAVFLYRVYTRQQQTWFMDDRDGKPWYNDWRALAGALVLSCICILIRSVYRTIEQSQGFGGSITSNEGLFYGLDTLPLFIAIEVYVLFWPGRFIPNFSPLPPQMLSPSTTILSPEGQHSPNSFELMKSGR